VADKQVTIWFDREGDFLEVIFENRLGYFRETRDDRVMEKVDEQGNVLGFSVMNISSLGNRPLAVAL
jgi:hypothetical protein